MWQFFAILAVVLFILAFFGNPLFFIGAAGSLFLSVVFGIAKMTAREITMIKCPFCKAHVPRGAKKCQHCGEWLERETGDQ